MSTYTKLVNHFVFSTRGRTPWLDQEVRKDLFAYMGGIIRNQRCAGIIVNGVDDHVHILAHVRPSLSVSDFMREVKSSSSDFVHKKFQIRDFAWQEGYYAVSVRGDDYADAHQYIERQQEHHTREMFEFEVRRFLLMADIPFEDKYLLG